jgi:hypothetical protein
MKKHFALLFTLAVGLLTAQAMSGQPSTKYPACPSGELFKQAYAMTTTHDEFDGTTTVEGQKIPLTPFKSITRFGSDEEFSIKLRGYPERSGSAFYLLFFIWSGHSFVFIDKDSPMLILVDGQKISIKPEGSPTRDVMDGGVFEEQVYRIPPSVITRIAKAGVLKLRVTGDKYIPDFTLPSKGACAVGRFVSEVIEKSPPPTDPNAEFFGAYALVTYNGANLPTNGIVSGKIQLFADEHYQFAYSDGQTTWYDERGTWRLDGGAIVLQGGTVKGDYSTKGNRGIAFPDWSGTINRTTISMNRDPVYVGDHPAMVFKR